MTVAMTPTADPTLSVPASQLIAALENGAIFASRDKTRPALCHLRVVLDPSSVMVEATDSYALIRHTTLSDWAGGEATTILVDHSDATALVRWMKSQKGAVLFLVTYDAATRSLRISLGMTGIGVTVPALADGHLNYPKTDQFFSDSSVDTGQVATFGIGAAVLAKLAKLKTSQKNNDQTGVPIKLTFGSTNLKPARFSVNGEIAGLVMPVRLSD